MKICSKCNEVKPLSDFYKQKKGKGGFRASCKPCANLATNIHWEKNHYKKYGITPEIKQNMLEKQNNSCAICSKVFKNKYDACLDHCHQTGKVRGILCRRCNSSLGQFRDSIQLLTKAVEYLSHYEIKDI